MPRPYEAGLYARCRCCRREAAAEMSASMNASMTVSYPGGKRVLMDKYAEIALLDVADNQRKMEEAEQRERLRKVEVKKALDEQLRLKQAAALREKQADRLWAQAQNERIQAWEEEEKKKIVEKKSKEASVRAQREAQLRELNAMRSREAAEKRAYETNILLDIRREMVSERAKEQERRRRDEENCRQVRMQNDQHLASVRAQRESDLIRMRQLEEETLAMAERQEQNRERELKKTYARQALQYAAKESMQEVLAKRAAADEARALERMKADAELAKLKEAEKRSRKAQMQKDALDVLAIQVREKQVRAQAESNYEAMIAARAKEEAARAEEMEARRRAMTKSKNMQYAEELAAQIKHQNDRKMMEPFLMSKHERQMNSSLLRSSYKR
uniref:Trichohyalin-plectin-homology domain-containing protein n=2 Tax=Chrysotila carterae TaxID=13221 RepID=A0A7S4B4K4_CHRCT|eukprot:6193890-Pleurochrysis_carterae.AAC.2